MSKDGIEGIIETANNMKNPLEIRRNAVILASSRWRVLGKELEQLEKELL